MKVYFDDVDDDERNRIKRKAGQKERVSTKGKKSLCATLWDGAALTLNTPHSISA